MPPKPAGAGKDRGGIVNVQQVECWRQRLKSEQQAIAEVTHTEAAKIGDLYRKNDYLNYYRPRDKEGKEIQTQGSTEPALKFTIDKVYDPGKFDAKSLKDTAFPDHTRKKDGFKSSRPVATSQNYGWYAPLDQPKYGFERTRICHDSFMDSSHL